MNPRYLRIALLSAAALMVSSSSVMAADIMVDGKFTSVQTPKFKTFGLNQTFGPWKVYAGSVDVMGALWQSPPGGGNSLELDGSRAGGVLQDLQTKRGAKYNLKFYISGNWFGGQATKNMTVAIGNHVTPISYTRPAGWSTKNMKWKLVSIPFTGSGQKIRISFLSREPASSSNGLVIGGLSASDGQGGGPAPSEPSVSPPKALSTVSVPLPGNLNDFVKNKNFAIAMGKSLFWDMQVGSDGTMACASCHFNAGADTRNIHTLHPGAPGSAFGPQNGTQRNLSAAAVRSFPGPNLKLKKGDFPFHQLRDPTRPKSSSNKVVRSARKVAGSQGVVKKNFVKVKPGNAVDAGKDVRDPVFKINSANVRQVTGRNAPTMINAVFLDRTFWDGRARNKFNGVNPFGDLDPNARVWEYSSSGGTASTKEQLAALWKKYPSWKKTYGAYFRKYPHLIKNYLGNSYSPKAGLRQVRISMSNASLASQAVGPVLSDVEMSWMGRSFPEVGRKMLSLKPLAKQTVSPSDSRIGNWANRGGKGVLSRISYSWMIRNAFHDKWWKGGKTPQGYTQMEANFSLFFGLAVNMYESTLVSDQSPFDSYARGNKGALSSTAKHGMDLFLNEGKCINCHGGPEFAGATISDLNGGDADGAGVIEFMDMANNGKAFYDGGFYNIGVRPTLEDLGVGARHPKLGPLSYARQRQNGRDVGQRITVGRSSRVAVDGAFKASSLRNVELTGPYMHNGGMKSLTEVVQFYTRGADFKHENRTNLDPDVSGISELQGDPKEIAAVVEFLKSLTDQRVRYERAPFDHPSLDVPNGVRRVSGTRAFDRLIKIPAVGRGGRRTPLKPFLP